MADVKTEIAGGALTFNVKHLKRWAARNPTSYVGKCGWTGAILTQVGMVDDTLLQWLSELFARPPLTWNCVETATTAYRNVDGWWVPKQDFPLEARPIGAPQAIRRVVAAAAARESHRPVEKYCRERGQLGLSGDSYTLAYSLLPLLVANKGGSVLIADRSNSFQTFKRGAIIEALEDLVEHTADEERRELGPLIDACLYCFVDLRSLQENGTYAGLEKTRVFFSSKDGVSTRAVVALAQGCSLSPVLEAITLAYAHGKLKNSTSANLALSLHDDYQTPNNGGSRVLGTLAVAAGHNNGWGRVQSGQDSMCRRTRCCGGYWSRVSVWQGLR